MSEIQQLTNEQVLERARKAFATGRTININFRRKQLENMHRMFEDFSEEIVDALRKDLRKPKYEAMLGEVYNLQLEIKSMLRNLKEYAAREYLPINALTFTDRAYIQKEPYGVVCVLGTWNYPFVSTCKPVIGAIAAGNVVILKPSECTPNSAELMFRMFAKYMDPECYQVVLGDVGRAKNLLTYKFDYIFCTGSTDVGRSVYANAASHLTPVTLELGGKSPCFIDDSSDVQMAAKRVIWGKCMNLGQTCIAPDYVLCSKNVEKEFIKTAKEAIDDWYGKHCQENQDLARIVNKQNFLRLAKMLEDTKGRVALGGKSDKSDLWIEPTIVVDVDAIDALMQQEIFGPILPIMIVSNVDAAISFIKSRPKPLALYTFSKDERVNEKLVNNVSSGGVCVNDVLLHNAWDGLPFGGVGDSGIGSYNGKASFDIFSHKKSVLNRSLSPISERIWKIRYPPYKVETIKKVQFGLNNLHKFRISPSWTKFNGFRDILIALAGAFLAYIYYYLFK